MKKCFIKKERRMEKVFNLPKSVEFIINRINQFGHRADIVGGPVRDFLLGGIPHDYDITTSARPEEIKEIFADFRTVDTGIKHGTVTLVLDGESYEITTYRIDGEYKDSRHPESVEFTKNLAEDLARRDFTVNAIAYNPRDGLCDLFGGREDIKGRIIRAVGDPEKRFSEDALRILRGIRFAATLGFEIDDKTALAMRKCKDLLGNVSAERIFVEWKKLISGDNSYEVIKRYRDIIAEFLPELASVTLPDKERYESSAPFVRMLSLFAALPEAGGVYRCAMARLKTDSQTRDLGALALTDDEKYDTSSELGLKIMMSELGAEVARIRLLLEYALGKREKGSLSAVDSIIERRLPYRISDLDINGSDVAALGFKGAAIGKALSSLLLLVMKGELENKRDALISALGKEDL